MGSVKSNVRTSRSTQVMRSGPTAAPPSVRTSAETLFVSRFTGNENDRVVEASACVRRPLGPTGTEAAVSAAAVPFLSGDGVYGTWLMVHCAPPWQFWHLPVVNTVRPAVMSPDTSVVGALFE